MKSNRRPIDIEAEYEATTKRASEVATLITACEKQLLDLKNEWIDLKGSVWGRRDGLVTKLHTELKYANLRVADQDASRVVWQNIPERPPKGEWIVEKVTPKRIFIRQPGWTNAKQYKRDGVPVAACFTDAFIDVEATLKLFKGKVPPCN